jgi:hypothetical protein
MTCRITAVILQAFPKASQALQGRPAALCALKDLDCRLHRRVELCRIHNYRKSQPLKVRFRVLLTEGDTEVLLGCKTLVAVGAHLDRRIPTYSAASVCSCEL